MKRRIRNAELVRRWKAGRSMLGLARRHGLTWLAVQAIVRKAMHDAA